MRTPKTISLFCVLLCLTLAACGNDPTPNVSTGPTQSLPYGTIPEAAKVPFVDLLASTANGITTNLLPNNTNPELAVFAIPSGGLEPTIVGHPQVGISPRSAFASEDLKLLIGSGFVSQTHSLEPVGLLQVAGDTLSPVQVHGYTRILGINDSGFGVVHRSAYSRELFFSALQAGPGIIEQGQLDITERDLQRPKYFRSFLGLCADHWLAGISLTPVHLRTLGESVLAWSAAQQLNCSEVVNLAGDRQAVLMATMADGTILYHGDINAHKVSLIGFR